MAKRSAEVDLTRPSDTESGEDDDREGPNQWRTWMTTMIIGAWIWWGEIGEHRPPDSVEDWGKELIANKHLKFLLRRETFIPDLLPSDHPFIQPKFTREPVPRWEPLYDYTIFFMRCQQDDYVDLELLAVAELRWVADGGILSMDSHANITAHNNRILAQDIPLECNESSHHMHHIREKTIAWPALEGEFLFHQAYTDLWQGGLITPRNRAVFLVYLSP